MLLTKRSCATLVAIALGTSMAAHAGSTDVDIDRTIIGADNNSADNAFVQPQDPALSGGGRDQTMQFGDVLAGRRSTDDFIIGRLGIDLLFGNGGHDILMGGIEHFNPLNRDRAFGGPGDDIFIWKPGDGSDLFWGGHHQDAIVFGVTGEVVNGKLKFEVLNDQQTAEVFQNKRTGLPKVDVTNSPGFCTVIDDSTSEQARKELDALNLDHLVQFSIRSVADDFDNGVQDEDNGLRVTLHLKDVEFLVCTERVGGVIQVLDLRKSPPVPIGLHEIKSDKLRKRLKRIVK